MLIFRVFLLSVLLQKQNGSKLKSNLWKKCAQHQAQVVPVKNKTRKLHVPQIRNLISMNITNHCKSTVTFIIGDSTEDWQSFTIKSRNEVIDVQFQDVKVAITLDDIDPQVPFQARQSVINSDYDLIIRQEEDKSVCLYNGNVKLENILKIYTKHQEDLPKWQKIMDCFEKRPILMLTCVAFGISIFLVKQLKPSILDTIHQVKYAILEDVPDKVLRKLPRAIFFKLPRKIMNKLCSSIHVPLPTPKDPFSNM